MRTKTVISLAAFPLMLILLAALGSCGRSMYNPEWATLPYPKNLHSTKTEDVHVFRRDTDIEIVNSSPRSYADFDVWINQRYVQHVDSLAAGKSIRLSLWQFFDEHGDRFNAGGFFRTYEPTPVRLVEIQPSDDATMLGLIAIRREEIVLPPERGQ